MLNRVLNGRYSLLFSFIIVFLVTSFLIRAGLLMISLSKLDLSFTETFKIFFLGFDYDLGIALMLSTAYNLYLLVFPEKWINSLGNRVITYSGLFLTLFICFFSFFAELTFWQEFESRFNFIAVDYLIYTYEVISNINESYPLPLLIGGVVIMTLLVIWILNRTGNFYRVFHSKMPFKHRLLISGFLLIVTISYPFLLSNDYAESSSNHYQNELSKAGIYSFFSAFKNNELNYHDFYALLPKNQAYQIIRKELNEGNSRFNHGGNSVRRTIYSDAPMSKPNVIMITVESLSADFMAHFGNNQNLTPVLDSLADHNLLFGNMYATGTRTVRGMEALSLGIPPT
ncbi:MAG: LTA synthase family protein, partial [Flavobacterium sp.]